MDSGRDAQQAGRVSPFGHRRVSGRLPPRRRFSQAAAPFFASYRLGIHRMRLFAWPYNPNRPTPRGNAPPSHTPPNAPPPPFASAAARPGALPLLSSSSLASSLHAFFPRTPPEPRLQPPARAPCARVRYPNLLKNPARRLRPSAGCRRLATRKRTPWVRLRLAADSIPQNYKSKAK